MSISRHLKLTLMLLIGIACVLAVTGLWAQNRIHKSTIRSLERQEVLTGQLGKVGSDMLIALDAGNRFLLNYPRSGDLGTRRYRDQAHQAVLNTRHSLKEIGRINGATDAPPNPYREKLEGLLSLFEVELKRVMRIIRLKGDASSGLGFEMKRMAEGLDRYLTSLGVRGNDPPVRVMAVRTLRNDLQFIRRWEKDYLLWFNPEVLVTANLRVGQMERALAVGPFAPMERQRVLTFLRTYMIYFERIALYNVQVFTELDRVNSISNQLKATLARYAENERAMMQRVQQKARAQERRMNIGLAAFLVILLALSSLLAVRLTRRITSRLDTLVGATEELGERGDCPPIEMQTEDEFARLADAFNGMVAKLREAQLHLVQSEKLVATGKLSASIAHEINNPLFGIQGCLERVLRGMPDDHAEHRLVTLAIRESQRIARLLEGLQNYHQPSDQTMGPVDLLSVLDDVFLINGKYLQHAGVTLRRQLPEVLPKVIGTRDQLQMVFVNLVTNAVEAMPGGGVLEVSVVQAPGAVLLRFTDSGKGIEPEALTRLFEPFFSTKAAVKGVGLGLSISYGIIKRHRGEIRVASEPGKTVFEVMLPMDHGGPEAGGKLSSARFKIG